MTNTANITPANHLIYTNSTRGVFEIELKAPSELILSNNIGEIILQKNYPKGRQTIDISNFSSGIYLLKILREGRSEMVKIRKE